MAQIACEMMQLRSFLTDLDLSVDVSMSMYCDNQVTIYIANNLTFHEHTKHIEVDCHYVLDMVMQGVISTPYRKSFDQFADIFTKGLSAGTYESLCTKLGMIHIYAPA